MGPSPSPSAAPSPAASASLSGDASPDARRPATLAELRALASPVRLRILRLALDEERTNKELAGLLGLDPATVLHHVRTLAAAGFLAPQPVRRGPRGSRERPYRATGLSWQLDSGGVAGSPVRAAMVEAFLAELAEVPPGAQVELSRLGLRLPAARRAEFAARLTALLDEFAGLPPDPGGEGFAVFAALYPRGPRS